MFYWRINLNTFFLILRTGSHLFKVVGQSYMIMFSINASILIVAILYSALRLKVILLILSKRKMLDSSVGKMRQHSC